MDNTLKQSFEQWDRQGNDSNAAYITLNNLYLWVESGLIKLTVHVANELRLLAGKVAQGDDFQLNYWHREFMELKGWFDV